MGDRVKLTSVKSLRELKRLSGDGLIVCLPARPLFCPLPIFAEAMEGAVRWFQLYPPKDHKLTDSFLQRAAAAGYSAIVVTIDSTLLGWRERDLRNTYLPFLSGHGMGNYFSDPVFLSSLDKQPEENLRAAVEKALDEGNHICFTWKELDYIRERTKLPLLIKGITIPMTRFSRWSMGWTES